LHRIGSIAASELKIVAPCPRISSQKPDALNRSPIAIVAFWPIAGSAVWAWALM
jgi:hypothetical protein